MVKIAVVGASGFAGNRGVALLHPGETEVRAIACQFRATKAQAYRL